MTSPLLLSLAESLGPPLLRALGSTLRVRLLPEGEDEAHRRRGEPVIYSFWHGRMLIPSFTHRSRKIAILISRHGDGELIARVLKRMGFVPVRGSTTRGGAAGLRAGMRLAERGYDLAFTPDGPRGPRYRVQRGVVFAASRTGLPIVPAAVEVSPRWVLRSWDEFTIPKPFATAVILTGEPFLVPAGAGEPELEEARRELERRMQVLTRRARSLLGDDE